MSDSETDLKATPIKPISVPSQETVILAPSIHFALAIETQLKREGVWCDLVPTPHALSSDCGMCLQIREDDAAKVPEVAGETRKFIRGIWSHYAAGWQQRWPRDA